MKNLIYTLVLFLVLTIFFSCLGYYPTETKENISSGTQYKGDSGLIIPGDGELLADTIIEPESTPEPSQGMEETKEETQTETIRNYNKTITKEKNKMDGMLLSFWHGVAAVLIGETVCLMVACAWMKIRRGEK